jgi:spermidine synthase
MPRFLLLLLCLFAGSGCAALMYEIVWLQLLQLVIGSSGVSLAVLLGTFMGGMCLGSLYLPRWIGARHHPLLVYGMLELGTGLFGVLVLFGLPVIQQLYLTGLGAGMAGILWRGVICAVCLLPPTMFMGATLPAMSRWIESTPNAASWWGVFYGGNIAGGVMGCVLAGFYLLRVYDMATTSMVAVAINVVVAAIACLLSKSAPYSIGEDGHHKERAEGYGMVYIAIGISGLCALGAEVVWTRLLSLMLGPTVYTFSIILGVFLTGLGLGSGAGSYLARRVKDPRVWLAGAQFLIALTVAWAAYQVAEKLPYWPGNLFRQATPWVGFENDIWRCTVGILPAAILWGASFPLALACVARKGQDPGRLVGEVYASNTVGAIVGSIGFSILAIPQLGSQNSERLLIAFATVAGILMLGKNKLAFAALASVVLIWLVPPIPWKLIGFGRRLPSTTGRWDLIYVGEGMNSSVAYSKWDGVRPYFHVSGKVEASAEPQDMRLQRLLGHLPALLHPNPQNILIVGCGAGVTAGTFVVHPEVQHITICEIEPLIPPHTAQVFGEENHNVIHDPRTRIVYDDARHYVLTTPEKYDIITSDPIHPWVKGIAPLYSTEYFELCKKHLKPGGLVTQWVPLYESNVETVKSEIATFFEAFPNGSMWGNLDQDGRGYDLVMLGTVEKMAINLDDLQAKLDRPDYAPVKRSLYDVGFASPMQLLSTYTVQASDLKGWLENAQINRDRNLRLQYLAGLGLNVDLGGPIYDEIISHSRIPAGIFQGSHNRVDALNEALREGRGYGR